MDYFTSRDKGLDDKFTKEESDNSQLYAQVREQLRSLFCGTRFMLSKQTRGYQKFRDYAHDKQRKTLQGNVSLFV